MLGPVGTVEGFDALWSAAAAVVPGLVGPELYPHHSLSDVNRVRSLLLECSWDTTEVVDTVSIRMCEADELWRWLWLSLPLLRGDGTFLEGTDRDAVEGPVRQEFFERVQLCRDADRFCIRSLAYVVAATAVDRPPSAAAVTGVTQ